MRKFDTILFSLVFLFLAGFSLLCSFLMYFNTALCANNIHGVGLMQKFKEGSTFREYHTIPSLPRLISEATQMFNFASEDYMWASGLLLLLFVGVWFVLVLKTRRSRKWAIIGASVLATLFYMLLLWKVSQSMDEINRFTGFPYDFLSQDDLAFWFLSLLNSGSYLLGLTLLNVVKIQLEDVKQGRNSDFFLFLNW